MGKGSKKQPPPAKPDWKILEEVVAKIQRYLLPDADVRHNHRVKGKSGRRRQLDVTVSYKIAGVPIFVVFECKRRNKRPVPMEEVEKFAGTLRDVREMQVGATVGVMVSRTGFDAGAKAIARQEQVALRNYRETDETDWAKLIAKGAWLTFYEPDFNVEQAQVTLQGEPIPHTVPWGCLSSMPKEGRSGPPL